ncbi:hypothetical protein [Rhizobium grahamii]|uniref:Uncharacterized protein n=1 Tax=Rhizobium grahamii CCGE 502 TaxID=990285 RepID=S3HDY9_9HYPH|nr:hypothetical protein [Rhizobium grahamii]EPE97052.1 hypothetical protein RGCCGE502_16850 [Rhizobium grahamii CCGE 502]
MKTIDVRKPNTFDARDLAACQPVFNQVLTEGGLEKGSEEADRIAAILVKLYREGVHDPAHLAMMVRTARGLLETRH